MVDWLQTDESTAGLDVGLFGASTGAAAALVAAAQRPDTVAAIVSRGGRPDLAGESLARVHQPTLLIVGARDPDVLGSESGRDGATRRRDPARGRAGHVRTCSPSQERWSTSPGSPRIGSSATSGPVRLALLGKPGSGKGTQGARLAGRLGVPLVSTGEILRRRAAAGGPDVAAARRPAGPRGSSFPTTSSCRS